MGSYFWLCRAGAQWRSDDSFDNAVRGNGVYGTLLGFKSLSAQISMGDDDAFCISALSKYDIKNDTNSQGFELSAAGQGVPPELYIWGHHDGVFDRYFMVIVTGLSALHLNPRARPEKWKQKDGPFSKVDHTQIANVASRWS